MTRKASGQRVAIMLAAGLLAVIGCGTGGEDKDIPDMTETGKPAETSRESPESLRERLTDEQYRVTQQCSTEPPFSGAYWDTKTAGVYHCVVCEAPLFTSETKFSSGSGWPSFWSPVSKDSLRFIEDRSHGMTRTEVRCGRCDAHLGHVFDDGPPPTGQRHCINSASLKLEATEK